MNTIENTIVWVLTSAPNRFEPAAEYKGHWENKKGERVEPKVGDVIDPGLCDKKWFESLKLFKMTTEKVPGAVTYLHVVSIGKAKCGTPRIRNLD